MSLKCQLCDEGQLIDFLSIPNLPLGNAFPRKEEVEKERRFDLNLAFCPNCCVVLQTKPPPVDALEDDYTNYRYVPTGQTLRTHYAKLAESIASDLGLGNKSFVVDIGSNDGTLLGLTRIFSNCRILGVEPAHDISELARKQGVDTITGFFTFEVARKILSEYGQPDVITLTQTLQHVPSVRDFLRDVAYLLRPGGVLVVEGRYLLDTIVNNNSYDTFYHEVLYLFSLKSLMKLLRTAGLKVYRAQMTGAYGGSLRIYAAKPTKKSVSPRESPSVIDILSNERNVGLYDYTTYIMFASKAKFLRNQLKNLISAIKKDWKSIVGYGAPSTSTTLLNFCEFGPGDISYIVDDNPMKQGLVTPGTHILISDSSELEKVRPDYILILAWRLKEEILSKLSKYTDQGTKVIIPLPEVEVV